MEIWPSSSKCLQAWSITLVSVRCGGLKDHFLDSGKIARARTLQQPPWLQQLLLVLQASWQGKVNHICHAVHDYCRMCNPEVFMKVLSPQNCPQRPLLLLVILQGAI